MWDELHLVSLTGGNCNDVTQLLPHAGAHGRAGSQITALSHQEQNPRTVTKQTPG